jgi:hypothetical protein
MARAGLERAPWEGPQAYGDRLVQAFPEQASKLREICATYARLRYGAPGPGDSVRTLETQMKEIHIP